MEILSMNVVVSAIVDPWVTTLSFVVALAMRIQGIKNTSNQDILHEISVLHEMYTHFQQIIRHRCVRAFQTRRGCIYGTLVPATNIGHGEKPAGTAAVSRPALALAPRPTPAPGPAPHLHPTSASRSLPTSAARTKKPHLK